MRLRVWICPECNKTIITPGYIRGIRCKCKKMLRLDCKSTRELVETECKENAEKYNWDIEYYKKRVLFVVPKQYKIEAIDLHEILIDNAEEYDFKDLLL